MIDLEEDEFLDNIKMPKKQKRKNLNEEIRNAKLRYKRHKRSPKLKADRSKVKSSSWCGSIPFYYQDYKFTCVDCGMEQIWTAAQQKCKVDPTVKTISSKK